MTLNILIMSVYFFFNFRVATTCGYLPSEIVGKAGMDFILGEDLPWTAMAQRHSQLDIYSCENVAIF